MKVYKFIKPLNTNLGSYNIGDRVFKQPDKDVKGTNNYYPEKGGYPIWDRNIPVQEYVEFVETVNKPISYFTDKKYSQFQLDEILNKKQG